MSHVLAAVLFMGWTSTVLALTPTQAVLDLARLQGAAVAHAAPLADGDGGAGADLDEAMQRAGKVLGLTVRRGTPTPAQLAESQTPCVALVSTAERLLVVERVEEAAVVWLAGQVPYAAPRATFDRSYQGVAWTIEPPVARGGAGDLAIAQGVHDLGPMVRGERRSFEVLVRNRGNGPLTIQGVQPSCGSCTVARAEQAMLSPGQHGRVLVEFAALNYGRNNAYVVLATDDSRRARTHLIIIAEVPEGWSVSPPRLALNLDAEQRTEATVGVRLPIGTALKAAELLPEAAGFEVGAVRPQPAGSAWLVDVLVSPFARCGRYQADLVLRTSSPERPRLTVPIEVLVAGDLVVSPPAVFLGTHQEPANAVELQATSRSGRPFELPSVKPAAPWVRLMVLKVTPAGATIRLSVEPPAAGHYETSVSIETTRPEQPMLVVPIIGRLAAR